jgi:chromate transporter
MQDDLTDGRRHTPAQIFLAFLQLGLSAFGGPVAHLGYFRAHFVARKRWLDDKTFAELVALCQFLPGPASSQVAFGIGLLERGLWGGLLAWFAFTLPSAILMILFAQYAARFDGPVAVALLHGLKVVAVAVVAQAVFSMARSQAPDARRALLAIAAMVFALLVRFPLSQPLLILAGGLAGLLLCRDGATTQHAAFAPRVTPRLATALLGAFVVLLMLALLDPFAPLHAFAAFYRSGALVFGGGHVVLPLLQQAVVTPGWIAPGTFLAGYGAAQALPGPLFAFAAYLGALIDQPPGGWAGAAIALGAISLPGLLLVAGIAPFWGKLHARPAMQAAVRGINATVVGILAAALYNPVWTSAVTSAVDMLLALAGFALLLTARVPVLAVVALIAGGETALALLH